jgi:hypothetical protein
MQSLATKIWNFLVYLVAVYMAQRLQHPYVKEAASNFMVAGIGAVITRFDPTDGEHIITM